MKTRWHWKKKYKISEYDINTMFLETKFAFDKNSEMFKSMLPVVGILVGILGIHITLQIIGGKIISTGMIEGIGEDTFSMNTVIPIWVILTVILISVLTVFISAWIPARKASRISPMEAIRQTKEIRIVCKREYFPRLCRCIQKRNLCIYQFIGG